MREQAWEEGKLIMAPLWIRYPYYTKQSAGLKSGEAAAYAERLELWESRLTDEERKKYRALFPEPVLWDAAPDKYLENGIFRVPKWQEEDVPETDASLWKAPFIVFENHPEREETVTKNCLSNWYLEPFQVEEKRYTCIEQYMMESKAILFGDAETGAEILAEQDPGQIKMLGRKIRGFNEELWNRFKYRIVLTGCYYKFACSSDLRRYLLSTGEATPVEANPADKIWGAALAADDPAIQEPSRWGGANLLGRILMEVRAELRRVYANEPLLKL